MNAEDGSELQTPKPEIFRAKLTIWYSKLPLERVGVFYVQRQGKFATDIRSLLSNC